MQKSFVRVGILAVVSLVATALVAGCSTNSGTISAVSPTANTSATSSTNITATYSNIAETASLDPAIVFSSDGLIFVRNVYETLLEYKPSTMDLQPLLAESWTISPDGLSYTFNIRSGVTFQDGSALDGAAVVNGLKRIQAINQGPASFMTNIVGISSPSSLSVVINLKNRDYTFLGKLPKLPIVSAAAVTAHKTASDPWAQTWFATNSAGSGPYMLDNWQRNQAITLKKFAQYWRPFASGTPTTVVLRVDPDISTAMQLLQAGTVDFMGAVGPDDSARAETMNGVQVLESPSYYIQLMPMNVTRGPLKDVRVRHAISLAFDYNQMIAFYQGFADAATGPLPTGFSQNIASRPKMTQNLVEAKKLLVEAGYSKGFTLKYLGLKGLSYEEFAGTVLQSSLAKIGIKVEQSLVPWPQMAAAYSKRSTAYDISFLNMSAWTDDAGNFLNSSYSSTTVGDKGGYNWSFLEDPAITNEIANLSQIGDAAKRLAATEVLNAKIADLYPAIYAAQPKLAQPARAGWTASYDSLDANYTIRFFYTRKVA